MSAHPPLSRSEAGSPGLLQPVSEPIVEGLICKLWKLVESLPLSIPEASEFDRLAVFGADPRGFDDPTISADELWETGLNNVLKATLGWGKEGDMNKIIRRGKWGLDGLVHFVTYFVNERGVSEGLFEGKLDYLIEELKKRIPSSTVVTVDMATSLAKTAMGADVGAASGWASYILESDDFIPALDGPIPTNVPVMTCDKEIEIVDVDMFEYKDTVKKPKKSATACKGFTLDFPDGKSPHTAYPFALHDTLVLPWDYAVKNNVMSLFATSCSGLSEGGGKPCQSCRQLIKNKTLEGIVGRVEDGTHESMAFAYLGIGALQEMLHRKTRAIEYYRLRGLNQARKLLAKATALSDQKRLLMVISSGKVSRVDRLLDIGLRQKKGARGLLASLMAAAEGHYTPKSFTQEEDMRSLLMWKMGGNRVAEINHRSNKAQSATYLRTRSTVPPITPSHEKPTINQVQANVEATFDGLLDVIHSQNRSSLVHAVLMFDELATEKRISWDPKTDYFLGLCREHAHLTSTEFVNEDDMEELYQNLDDGKVHYAGEATVGALGVLCKDNRIYPSRPVLVSGDCKKENGEEHAQVIKIIYDGVNSLQPKTKLRITSLASDGETRRGSAFVSLTFKSVLKPESRIYPLLKPLKFLNLHVGDDDLTCDKDWKHVFKRWRNLLLRQRGVVVNGFRITPDIIRDQFKSEGLSAEHIRSLFNPEDQQDVKMAFDMLKDIWNLPRSSANSRRGFLEARKAIWVLGKPLFHMIFPYLCVDLSLSEQIEHLSAAAHLALALFRLAGKKFIPTNLYIDLMIMIKNAIISIAKAKIDDLDGEFWIILLGTDRLEELFGILRTMVGNDANLDILQLTSRLAGTTEVSNILAKYPQWDRSPRRLKLPAMSRDSKEIPDSADHIKPSSWRGNVKVKDVSLQTSWNRGRRMVEEECEGLKPILHELNEIEGIDILSPFGTLLVNVPLSADDIDESLEAPTIASANNDMDAHETEMRVDVEDALAAELASSASNTEMLAGKRVFNSKVLVKGTTRNKARALKEFGKYRKYTSSTDRLKRVQSIPRFVDTEKGSHSSSKDVPEPHVEDSQKIIISDPIASLIRVENSFRLCIGEVNGLRVDGRLVDYISSDMLAEETVSVSYQMLGLRPATLADDPEGGNDWRMYMMKEHSHTVPGRLVQSIDPATSKTPLGMPFYLLQSTVLVALSASLFQGLAVSDLKNVPKFKPTQEYPYREASGHDVSEIDTLVGTSAEFQAGTGGVEDASDESGNESLGDGSEEELEDEPDEECAEEDAVELDDQDSFEDDDEYFEDIIPRGVGLGGAMGGEEREEQGNLHPSCFVRNPEDFEVGPVEEESFYDSLQVSEMSGHQVDGRTDTVQSIAEPPAHAAAFGTEVVEELGRSKRKRVVRQADALNGFRFQDGHESLDGIRRSMLPYEVAILIGNEDVTTLSYHIQCLEIATQLQPLDLGTWKALGFAYRRLYEQSQSNRDLDKEITAFHHGLEPAPHPDRSTSLNNLAKALQTRFGQQGASNNLDKAISLHREALLLCLAPHPDHSGSLIYLGWALQTRFGQRGASNDLDGAISLHQEVLLLCPAPHPNRSASLNNLANAFQTHLKQLGGSNDLDEAISLHREALLLLPAPHPDCSSSLNNLASALRTRFEQRGASNDLDKVISLHQEALLLCPAPHPDRSASLINLGWALHTRFEQRGASNDLNEAISLHQEALLLCPAPHPHRSALLNNFANALRTRFDQQGTSNDLDEVILLHREVLLVQPAPHPDRSDSLFNLANTLQTRFEQRGALNDLDEVISLHQEALTLFPVPHHIGLHHSMAFVRATLRHKDILGHHYK
ncbi:hypothetical protein H0H81_000401 [Sphagnurus paluster]|uniref:Uncharacterized protein n=1 Tax=Sphagnurus paluster TaxID=117069 RepID=A0A9P7FPG5_9AGAR|nr:hypothetical protein H0H81_000401 [Sphagnurus paluster]